MMPELWIHA